MAGEIEASAGEKIKRRRNRPDLEKFGEENTEPGDNARYLRYALVSLDLPPIDISDAAQVEKRIREYFSFCMDKDRRPTIAGICNWLGVTRETLNTWKRGEYRGATHSDMIKKAYGLIEEMLNEYMVTGKINPVSAIFLLKNICGYRDQVDIVAAPAARITEESAADVAERYKALPED